MKAQLEAILRTRVAKAAAYAGTGYLLTHSITSAHTWVEAGVAVSLAVLGAIHASTGPAGK